MKETSSTARIRIYARCKIINCSIGMHLRTSINLLPSPNPKKPPFGSQRMSRPAFLYIHWPQRPLPRKRSLGGQWLRCRRWTTNVENRKGGNVWVFNVQKIPEIGRVLRSLTVCLELSIQLISLYYEIFRDPGSRNMEKEARSEKLKFVEKT